MRDSIKPYYENEYGVLYKGDCLEIMPMLRCKVNLVLTDPPYSETKAKWDSIIPFESMWGCILPKIKNAGAFIFFGNEPFSSSLRNSNKEDYRHDYIWLKSKTTGFQNANFRPLRKFENIMVFSKFYASPSSKNKMIYNPQGVVEINKVKKNNPKRYGLISYKNNNTSENNKLQGDSEYIQKYTNYPDNVLSFDLVETREHPTQKPVALLEYLIRTYSNENDLVLDFAAGSSSTAIACMNTNRKFIMIEKEEKYCEVSAKRMEEHLNKMKSEFEDI